MLSLLRLPFSPHGPPFPSSFWAEGNWREETKHGMVKSPPFGGLGIGSIVERGKQSQMTSWRQAQERKKPHLNQMLFLGSFTSISVIVPRKGMVILTAESLYKCYASNLGRAWQDRSVSIPAVEDAPRHRHGSRLFPGFGELRGEQVVHGAEQLKRDLVWGTGFFLPPVLPTPPTPAPPGRT